MSPVHNLLFSFFSSGQSTYRSNSVTDRHASTYSPYRHPGLTTSKTTGTFSWVSSPFLLPTLHWEYGFATSLSASAGSWGLGGLKWPEPPVSPDLEERREAHSQLLDLLSQNRDASYAISQALREMMEQDTKHHEEIRRVLSDSQDTLSKISSDAQRIVEVTEALSKNVRVVAAFEVDRLLRKLPQSIQEDKSEPRPPLKRWASA